MQLTMFNDWPNLVGRKQAFVAKGTGPAAYVLGGDPVTLPGYNTYIDAAFTATTVSGNYTLSFFPNVAGPRAAWKAKWAYAPGNSVAGTAGAEVSVNTVLSGESVIVSGFASGS